MAALIASKIVPKINITKEILICHSPDISECFFLF